VFFVEYTFLSNSLNFILRFLAMAELMQASLCSFGLTKTFYRKNYSYQKVFFVKYAYRAQK